MAANVLSTHLRYVVVTALEGDWPRADALRVELDELFARLAVETRPIPVKWAAFRKGLIEPGMRLPLMPLAHSQRDSLEGLERKLGLLPPEEAQTPC